MKQNTVVARKPMNDRATKLHTYPTGYWLVYSCFCLSDFYRGLEHQSITNVIVKRLLIRPMINVTTISRAQGKIQ